MKAAQARQGEPGTWRYGHSKLAHSYLATSKPLPGTFWAARTPQAVRPSSDHQGWFHFSTGGFFHLPRGHYALRPLQAPVERKAAPGGAPACTRGRATRAVGPWARWPERTAAGRRRAWRCVCRSRRRESPRTARASRAGRQGLNGRTAGALRESPRPWPCPAAPCPAHPPAGTSRFPPRCPIPALGWRPAPPPAVTASGSAHGGSPFEYDGTRPKGEEGSHGPSLSSCGQSAPSLTSRQPSARPPAGVGGQRERRAGMFTNKIGE